MDIVLTTKEKRYGVFDEQKLDTQIFLLEFGTECGAIKDGVSREGSPLPMTLYFSTGNAASLCFFRDAWTRNQSNRISKADTYISYTINIKDGTSEAEVKGKFRFFDSLEITTLETPNRLTVPMVKVVVNATVDSRNFKHNGQNLVTQEQFKVVDLTASKMDIIEVYDNINKL